MEPIRFLLSKEDLDDIRVWIDNGSLDAAQHCLERPYISDHITADQATELAVLRIALATAFRDASRRAP